MRLLGVKQLRIQGVKNSRVRSEGIKKRRHKSHKVFLGKPIMQDAGHKYTRTVEGLRARETSRKSETIQLCASEGSGDR